MVGNHVKPSICLAYTLYTLWRHVAPHTMLDITDTIGMRLYCIMKYDIFHLFSSPGLTLPLREWSLGMRLYQWPLITLSPLRLCVSMQHPHLITWRTCHCNVKYRVCSYLPCPVCWHQHGPGWGLSPHWHAPPHWPRSGQSFPSAVMGRRRGHIYHILMFRPLKVDTRNSGRVVILNYITNKLS